MSDEELVIEPARLERLMLGVQSSINRLEPSINNKGGRAEKNHVASNLQSDANQPRRPPKTNEWDGTGGAMKVDGTRSYKSGQAYRCDRAASLVPSRLGN